LESLRFFAVLHAISPPYRGFSNCGGGVKRPGRFFVRLKAAFLPRPDALSAPRAAAVNDGASHRRRRREASLTAASTMPT
jgi:hypothetical protein